MEKTEPSDEVSGSYSPLLSVVTFSIPAVARVEFEKTEEAVREETFCPLNFTFLVLRLISFTEVVKVLDPVVKVTSWPTKRPAALMLLPNVTVFVGVPIKASFALGLSTRLRTNVAFVLWRSRTGET